MKGLLGLTVAVLFVSCGGTSPYYVSVDRQKENKYYYPFAASAFSVTKKNDISLSVQGNFTAGHFHAAYMPSNTMALQIDYMRDEYDVSTEVSSSTPNIHSYYSLSAGYIKSFSNNLHFETYGGFTFGNIRNQHYTGMSKINLTQFFIQPGIAVFSNNGKAHIGFVSKFATSNFKLKDTTFNNDRESYSALQVRKIVNNPSHIFWEPGITARVGSKKVFFVANYNVSADISGSSFHQATNNFEFGINIKLNIAKKESSAEKLN